MHRQKPTTENATPLSRWRTQENRYFREFDTAKAAKPAMALFFCLFLFLRIAYMRIWWYNKYMTTMSCRGDAYAYYER